ncbi:MAG: peptidoglycan editing factor PgeF [Panacagrimonas sp.]
MIRPEWVCHPRVRACFTTRAGGVSRAPYALFNLAMHVGDDPAAVLENRRRLRERLGLVREPGWIEQVHGTRVVSLAHAGAGLCADASWTDQAGLACAVLTADCLPVLFADDEGRCVAAAHAGWKGLLAGVLESTVATLPVRPERLQAWIGPAIGARVYQVGDEVRRAFVERDAKAAIGFSPDGPQKHLCDLALLARRRLQAVGVDRVSGGDFCTVSDASVFFSFRRDRVCGRMAALIWLEPV